MFTVSTVTGEGMESLQEEIQKRLLTNINYLQKKVRIPLSGQHLRYASERNAHFDLFYAQLCGEKLHGHVTLFSYC